MSRGVRGNVRVDPLMGTAWDEQLHWTAAHLCGLFVSGLKLRWKLPGLASTTQYFNHWGAYDMTFVVYSVTSRR